MKKLLNTLYITTPESYLSLNGETVVINHDDEKKSMPLHNIDCIMICGGKGVTPALMGKCAKKGIELIFMSRDGQKFLAKIEGEVNGNVFLRREQYRIADDTERSLEIAKNIISAKVYNSRMSIERTIRDHALRIDVEKFKKKSEFLRNSIPKIMNCSNMEQLRGIEGESASIYFSVLDDMILQQKDDFAFHGRNKRPPLDNVNAMLSFAYTLCETMCSSALKSVGLDAYVGFMHTDRPGRPSLALDLLEEFRCQMCDRFVLTLINKKIVKADCFMKQANGAVLLTDDGRNEFCKAWQNKKHEEIKHPFLGEKVQWGMVPYAQALLLARYIRGDLDCYPPFMWK